MHSSITKLALSCCGYLLVGTGIWVFIGVFIADEYRAGAYFIGGSLLETLRPLIFGPEKEQQ